MERSQLFSLHLTRNGHTTVIPALVYWCMNAACVLVRRQVRTCKKQYTVSNQVMRYKAITMKRDICMSLTDEHVSGWSHVWIHHLNKIECYYQLIWQGITTFWSCMIIPCNFLCSLISCTNHTTLPQNEKRIWEAGKDRNNNLQRQTVSIWRL